MANFKQIRKSPVSNDRLIRVDDGSDISLGIITGMLLGPIAFFKLKVFITSSISSAVVGNKKNVFFSSFPAIPLDIHYSSFPLSIKTDLIEYFTSHKALMILHTDAPNSHVLAFLESLVNALSTPSHSKSTSKAYL